jgi:hypothetical protein
MKWGLMSTVELKQLQDAYNVVANTGTLAWDLPEYSSAGYKFKTYSGTTMQEPEIGKYFVGWVEDVTLVIMNVRT